MIAPQRHDVCKSHASESHVFAPVAPVRVTVRNWGKPSRSRIGGEMTFARATRRRSTGYRLCQPAGFVWLGHGAPCPDGAVHMRGAAGEPPAHPAAPVPAAIPYCKPRIDRRGLITCTTIGYRLSPIGYANRQHWSYGIMHSVIRERCFQPNAYGSASRGG